MEYLGTATYNPGLHFYTANPADDVSIVGWVGWEHEVSSRLGVEIMMDFSPIRAGASCPNLTYPGAVDGWTRVAA